jgi:hypothetical protein
MPQTIEMRPGRAARRTAVLLAVVLATLFGVTSAVAAPPWLSSGTQVTVQVRPYHDAGVWAVQIPLYIKAGREPGVVIDMNHANGANSTVLIMPNGPLLSADGTDGAGKRLWLSSDWETSLADVTGRWVLFELIGTRSGGWTFRLWSDRGKVLRTLTGKSKPAYAPVTSVSIESIRPQSGRTEVGVGDITVHIKAGYDTVNGGRDAARAMPRS